MADSSYNLEVQNILSFLKMQHMNPDPQFIEAISTDINPECLVSPRYLKKYRNKQVSQVDRSPSWSYTLSSQQAAGSDITRANTDLQLHTLVCFCVVCCVGLGVRAASDASQMSPSWHQPCLALECILPTLPLYFLFPFFPTPSPLTVPGGQSKGSPNPLSITTVESLTSDCNRYFLRPLAFVHTHKRGLSVNKCLLQQGTNSLLANLLNKYNI